MWWGVPLLGTSRPPSPFWCKSRPLPLLPSPPLFRLSRCFGTGDGGFQSLLVVCTLGWSCRVLGGGGEYYMWCGEYYMCVTDSSSLSVEQ